MRADSNNPYPFWGAKPLYSGSRRLSFRSEIKELDEAGPATPCSKL